MFSSETNYFFLNSYVLILVTYPLKGKCIFIIKVTLVIN